MGGRTGAYICLDVELERLKHEGKADLYNALVSARRARPNVVATWNEYVLMHRAFVDYVLQQAPAPAPGLPADVSAFLVSLNSSLVGDFDIGRGGRKIFNIGEFTWTPKTVRKSAAVPKQVKVAICSDVILVAQASKSG